MVPVYLQDDARDGGRSTGRTGTEIDAEPWFSIARARVESTSVPPTAHLRGTSA